MASPVDLAEQLRRAMALLLRSTFVQGSDVTPAQLDTLSVLDELGRVTVARLASARRVAHQGASRTLSELERRGLVARTAWTGDARAVEVAVTELGLARLREVREARSNHFQRTIDQRCTAEERALLERVPELLRRLVDSER